MDVSRPSQTPADSTSRPVIVSNRPLMQDPMMATVLSGKSEPEAPMEAKDDATEDAQPLTPHAEKIIKPIETEVAEQAEAAADLPEQTAEKAPAAAETAPEADAEAVATETEPEKTAEPKLDKKDEPEPQPAVPDTIETDEADGDDKQTNPEAVKLSEADRKRAAELEAIIASGKYAVPIDASGKRRTLIITIWLVVLTLLLAVVLADALLDVGILNVQGIPHTHFFSLT